MVVESIGIKVTPGGDSIIVGLTKTVLLGNLLCHYLAVNHGGTSRFGIVVEYENVFKALY